MADPIDLGAALDTVVATFAQEFNSFKTVAVEDEDRKKREKAEAIAKTERLGIWAGNPIPPWQFRQRNR